MYNIRLNGERETRFQSRPDVNVSRDSLRTAQGQSTREEGSSDGGGDKGTQLRASRGIRPGGERQRRFGLRRGRGRLRRFLGRAGQGTTLVQRVGPGTRLGPARGPMVRRRQAQRLL